MSTPLVSKGTNPAISLPLNSPSFADSTEQPSLQQLDFASSCCKIGLKSSFCAKDGYLGGLSSYIVQRQQRIALNDTHEEVLAYLVLKSTIMDSFFWHVILSVPYLKQYMTELRSKAFLRFATNS